MDQILWPRSKQQFCRTRYLAAMGPCRLHCNTEAYLQVKEQMFPKETFNPGCSMCYFGMLASMGGGECRIGLWIKLFKIYVGIQNYLYSTSRKPE